MADIKLIEAIKLNQTAQVKELLKDYISTDLKNGIKIWEAIKSSDNNEIKQEILSIPSVVEASKLDPDEIIKKIGDYEISDEKTKLFERIKESHRDEVTSYLGTQSDASNSDPASARKAFIKAFMERVKELKDKGEDFGQSPISLDKLFGSKGLRSYLSDDGRKAIELRKLYDKALEEEGESADFKKAVLANSLFETKATKKNKDIRLVVSGITGIGKTRAADSYYQELIRKDTESGGQDQQESVNKSCIFIDGAIGREVSQIRNLVLSTALNLNATMISDLTKNRAVGSSDPLKVDKKIQKTFKDIKGVDLIMTDTLARVGRHKVYKSWMKKWMDDGFHIGHLAIKVDPQKREKVLSSMDKSGKNRAALGINRGQFSPVMNRANASARIFQNTEPGLVKDLIELIKTKQGEDVKKEYQSILDKLQKSFPTHQEFTKDEIKLIDSLISTKEETKLGLLKANIKAYSQEMIESKKYRRSTINTLSAEYGESQLSSAIRDLYKDKKQGQQISIAEKYRSVSGSDNRDDFSQEIKDKTGDLVCNPKPNRMGQVKSLFSGAMDLLNNNLKVKK